jgi:N-acetyl-gamma-glutamyl-phosphate reductase
LFCDYYKKDPCVEIMPEGSSVETRWVRGSNLCRIAGAQPGEAESLVVQSALDNLVKGAAGQAVQNMNLMFGLEETSGLLLPPLSP